MLDSIEDWRMSQAGLPLLCPSTQAALELATNLQQQSLQIFAIVVESQLRLQAGYFSAMNAFFYPARR